MSDTSQTPAPAQSAGLVQTAAAPQHRTTAAAGMGGSLSIVIMSILLHCGVHLTEEEAIAWTGVVIGLLGWGLKFIAKRYPSLDVGIADAEALASQVTPAQAQQIVASLDALHEKIEARPQASPIATAARATSSDDSPLSVTSGGIILPASAVVFAPNAGGTAAADPPPVDAATLSAHEPTSQSM